MSVNPKAELPVQKADAGSSIPYYSVANIRPYSNELGPLYNVINILNENNVSAELVLCGGKSDLFLGFGEPKQSDIDVFLKSGDGKRIRKVLQANGYAMPETHSVSKGHLWKYTISPADKECRINDIIDLS